MAEAGGSNVFRLQRPGATSEGAGLKGTGGNGTSDGMDPWQQSVETRLASLDDRLGRVEGKLGDIAVDVGKLTVRVDALPTKGFIVYATMGGMAFVAAASAFVQWVLSIQA